MYREMSGFISLKLYIKSPHNIPPEVLLKNEGAI
jgi:hypothetical protein